MCGIIVLHLLQSHFFDLKCQRNSRVGFVFCVPVPAPHFLVLCFGNSSSSCCCTTLNTNDLILCLIRWFAILLRHPYASSINQNNTNRNLEHSITKYAVPYRRRGRGLLSSRPLSANKIVQERTKQPRIPLRTSNIHRTTTTSSSSSFHASTRVGVSL